MGQSFTATQDYVANKRVGFYKVNVFSIFMIYLAFSKFGHLRIGGQSVLSLKPFHGLRCYLVGWELIVVLEYFRTSLSFLSPPWQKAELPKQPGGYEIHLLHWGFHAWAVYAGRLSLAFYFIPVACHFI
jgi:choline/glycine/proline betaine transport protein